MDVHDYVVVVVYVHDIVDVLVDEIVRVHMSRRRARLRGRGRDCRPNGSMATPKDIFLGVLMRVWRCVDVG